MSENRREASTRISLRLSDQWKARIDAIKEDLDCASLTETTTRLIRLGEVMLEIQRSGQKIAKVDAAGNVTQIEIIL